MTSWTRRHLLLTAALAVPGLTACGSRTTGSPTSPPTGGGAPAGGGGVANPAALVERRSGTAVPRGAGDPATARRAFADFGADLLRAVADGTTVISPWSLFSVLAMVRVGARGDTATQLDALLRLDRAGQALAATAVDAGIDAARSAAATVPVDDPTGRSFVVEAANETWVQRDLPVRSAYLDAVAAGFGAGAVSADFAADPDAVCAEINRWVDDRTHGLVPDLFPPGTIDGSTVMALVNAVYLSASWADPFYPQNGNFTTAGGDAVSVPVIVAALPVSGATGPGWRSATLPYRGAAMAMTVLLPDAGEFDRVLAELDAVLVAEASRDAGSFAFTLPTFSIDAAPDVESAVRALGLVDLFDAGRADLSGIAGDPGALHASAFVHRAVITVDQYGTEAAAASGMAIAASAPRYSEEPMVVDRPFLFWVAETVTGAPLFLGVVTDPR